MPYYLDNAFLLDNPWITVVGCGGTGGFVAEGLCRLFQGRQATIVLVDHDRVEPHNLLRQNFYAEDVGKFKPTFPIWLNIPLSKSSAFFKPLSICETLAVDMAIITP